MMPLHQCLVGQGVPDYDPQIHNPIPAGFEWQYIEFAPANAGQINYFTLPFGPSVVRDDDIANRIIQSLTAYPIAAPVHLKCAPVLLEQKSLSAGTARAELFVKTLYYAAFPLGVHLPPNLPYNHDAMAMLRGSYPPSPHISAQRSFGQGDYIQNQGFTLLSPNPIQNVVLGTAFLSRNFTAK